MCRKSVTALLLLTVVLAGCERPFGFQSGPEISPSLEQKDQGTLDPGLEVRLLGPARVAPGDSFRVQFQLENKTASTIRVKTGACWGQPAVSLDGKEVPLIGSRQVCTSERLTWDLSSKSTRTRDFDLTAAMNASVGSPEVGRVSEPGTYTLRTTLDWTVQGQDVDDALEGTFEVVSRY